MRQLMPVIGILLVMLTTGCSHQLQRQTCVKLTPEVNYCLAPLLQNSSNSEQVLSQKISFTHGEKHHELLTELALDTSEMTLVGLAPIGQPLFTVTYNGDEVLSQQNVLMGEDFKAEYLMAIMQLIYWPHEQVNGYLNQGEMIDFDCQQPRCSALMVNKKHAITIDYSDVNPWKSNVSLHFPAANITLVITPLL
ncbi:MULTISPECIES: DUF3261 domain-containing protein [unclassified Shewanella]|uniref:DUF3261 domain-containing protein n=1 Tax=unclassified Shewanella TaxID=196818 RepID=UPI0006D68576|nr:MULTISPECIES: DUF3261 domain-containing protein [unclassified Shewanella]KPZ69605.1 hypothetical protein AN944_02857 [Shewanella sp. P1-14-1]